MRTNDHPTGTALYDSPLPDHSERVASRGNPLYQAILSKTHHGLAIYSHILRLYYPDTVVLKLKERDCGLCRNPFNLNKETLHVWVEKERVLGDARDAEHAHHEDAENAIPAGDAFDFAELHYQQHGEELLQTLNKELGLHLEQERNRYRRVQQAKAASNFKSPPNQGNHKKPINHSSDAFFSFFKAPIHNIKPHKTITLLDAYHYIIGPYAKQRTEKLRTLSDAAQARRFKAANFDYCTFSGVFTTRSDKALIKHSGLLCIDFDHLPSVDMLRHQLLQDEYFDTQLLFVSPSGDGLKWIIQTNPPLGGIKGGFTHGDYFAAVARYIRQAYGVEVDKSGRDTSRACFLPHDPQAYINQRLISNF